MGQPQFKAFRGLNNTVDSLRLGFGWLSAADDINITETGAIRRRDGYAMALAAVPSGAYATRKYDRLYLVDAGALKRVNGDMSTKTIASGLPVDSFHAAEVNEQVYYSAGASKGIILPDDTVLPWAWPDPTPPDLIAVDGDMPAGTYQVACTFILDDGRETGASDADAVTLEDGQAIQINNIPQQAGMQTAVYIAPADSTVFQFAFVTGLTSASWNASLNELGADLTTQFLDSPPTNASYPAFWNGRMFLMEYFPDQNYTTIWFSEPLAFHLFNLNQNFVSVPGQGVLLAATDTGLVIGTTAKIYAWDGNTLSELANYGAVPGWNAARDDATGNVLFWTTRGICSAPPFTNMTIDRLSVAPGINAGAAIIEHNGNKRFVVALQAGGTAFNPHS